MIPDGLACGLSRLQSTYKFGRSAAYLNEKVMAKITVGPVIGKVTDTTARILIEVDGDVQITCDATDTNKNVVTQRSWVLPNLECDDLSSL